MASRKWSPATIVILWISTGILYLMFMFATDITDSALPRIMLGIWLLSILVATVITWNWIKSGESSEES